MSLSILVQWIRPTLDALFSRDLPWHLRWRLLCFQAFIPITYTIGFLPWTFSARYSVISILTRHRRSVRAIVFRPPVRAPGGPLVPLHLDVHGGGFLGGIPESEATFLAELSDRTGCVVVSTQYRYAPRHPFPAAIDDVDDVVQYLLAHAEERFGADPKLFTVSGFSAGGNLVLATSLQEACRPPSQTAIKAAVTFYAPVDLRLPPNKKLRPQGFPKVDPIWLMESLFDSYARLALDGSDADPRLHPCLASLEQLPRNILFVVPTMDILCHEQTAFYQRLKNELEEVTEGEGRRIELMLANNQVHGFLERVYDIVFLLKLTGVQCRKALSMSSAGLLHSTLALNSSRTFISSMAGSGRRSRGPGFESDDRFFFSIRQPYASYA